jgi:hypothetical protein
MVSFVAFACVFSHHEEDTLSIPFILEIVSLVLFGKTFITFLILEIIQLKNRGFSYFLDVWNIMDLLSLALNFCYVGGEFTNMIAHEDLQIVGAVAVALMWVKLFYWMKIFKPFSAFIRMISEIIKDIRVFMVMLIISLGAFANIIFILNINREKESCTSDPDCGPIYESLVGFAPIDALIHAYLTGLGEFGKDNYS